MGKNGTLTDFDLYRARPKRTAIQFHSTQESLRSAMVMQLVRAVRKNFTNVGQVVESLGETETQQSFELGRFSHDRGDSGFARNTGEDGAVDSQDAEGSVAARESGSCIRGVCGDSLQ